MLNGLSSATVALCAGLALGSLGCGATPPDPTVNREDSENLTPLMRAAARGEIANVRALLAKGANPNLQSSEQDITALMCACYFGHTEVVKALLAKGAKLQLRDAGGNGPLDWAAVGGHKELARFLADKGAKLNAKGGGGGGALGSFLSVGSMPMWFMDKAAGKRK